MAGTHPLQNQLGNTITRLDWEIDVRVIEQEHLDLSAVVGINDTSTSVDEVLSSKTTTGSNAAVCIPRQYADTFSTELSIHK